MTKSTQDVSTCRHCKSGIQEDDEFCPSCGELFETGEYCTSHANKAASGVCIVCCRAFCDTCGRRVRYTFLCNDHMALEIYQGMARVFGSHDTAHVEFAKNSLETAGLHPFIFSRKTNPISMGGPDYTLFRASGEYDGHIINEIKLMVPCQEVPEAQRTLRALEFLP